MNELQIFKNEEFGEVRATEKDGQIMFVAKDICECLGLGDTSKAMSRLEPDERDTNSIPTLGGKQEMWCVNEYGLFNLILASRKQSAKKFKRWVTHEVLPSIRQNGGYIANQENLTPEQIVANALVVAQKIIESKDKLITEMKPKAEFFDAVADSRTALPMDKVAKVLDIKGIGRNKLFELLRERKVLDRNNIPYQTFVDRGYFRIVEQKYTKPNGETEINIKTLVYQKGVDYIRKLVA